MSTALLTATALTHHGGAPMRHNALLSALGCHHYLLACDKWAGCAKVCAADGVPHPEGFIPGWYFNRAWCPRYGAALVERLTADGMTTLVCSGLDTALYVPLLAAQPQFRVIHDLHNVERPLWAAIFAAVPPGSPFAFRGMDKYVARVGEVEGGAVAAADEVWVCSPPDREQLREVYPAAGERPVRVVPNVVPVPAGPPAVAVPERVVFTGRLDWYPNHLAARMIINEIAPRLDLPVVIAGARLDEVPPVDTEPPANVRLIANPATTDDLIRGSVLLVPLTLGGGSRLKILEAFASGTPVISTAKGVEGLDVLPGVHYLPAETADEFVTRTHAVRRDADLRQRLVHNGFARVREAYSVETLRGLLDSTAPNAH